MRVLLDTNIIISALVTPSENSPASLIIQALFWQQFTLLLPQELREEIVKTVVEKKRLRKTVTISHIETMMTLLARQAEQMPPIGAKIPAVSRDPKDDYLPAYALVAKADYLVTGDKDLLVLKQVGQVKILSPKDFVARLQLQSRGEA